MCRIGRAVGKRPVPKFTSRPTAAAASLSRKTAATVLAIVNGKTYGPLI